MKVDLSLHPSPYGNTEWVTKGMWAFDPDNKI